MWTLSTHNTEHTRGNTLRAKVEQYRIRMSSKYILSEKGKEDHLVYISQILDGQGLTLKMIFCKVPLADMINFWVVG